MASAQEKYEAAKARTQAAAEKDAEAQEALRKKMESGKTRAPAQLTRKELALARRMDDDGSVKPKKRFRR